MILIDKNTNAVLASGKNIEVADTFTLIDGKKYHEWKTINSRSIGVNIPYGKPHHWNYMNGNFELTPSGVQYAETLAIKDMQEKAQALTDAVQSHLDERAKQYRYDNMKSARAMAGVPLDGTENSFEIAMAEQAINLAKWDRAVWSKSTEIEAEVLSGIRGLPTVEELIAELPPLIM